MCAGLLQLSLLAKISEKLNERLPAALIGNMITNITIILPTSNTCSFIYDVVLNSSITFVLHTHMMNHYDLRQELILQFKEY